MLGLDREIELEQGFPTWGYPPGHLKQKGRGCRGKVKTKNNYLFNMGMGNHYKIPAIISPNLKIIIIIVVDISLGSRQMFIT